MCTTSQLQSLMVVVIVSFAMTGHASCAEVTPIDGALEPMTLFTSKLDGYHTYRIPALALTNSGTLLAVCEGRKYGSSDHGDVDLVMRRSADRGESWSQLMVLTDDGDQTMGNPCIVVERKSGTIWLLLSRNNKQILAMSSQDDGLNWTLPVDITRQVTDPRWHWFGTGPGHGIQLPSGRLLIPCWADAAPRIGDQQFSFVFLSDDAGMTWKRGGVLTHNASDECEVVELSNGDLHLNARSRQAKRQRAVAYSCDGGESWTPIRYEPQLPESSCQGSVVRCDATTGRSGSVLLVAPASQTARADLTARLSYDDGKTWPVSKVIHPAQAGYSDSLMLDDGKVLVLYEADYYSKLVLVRIRHAWLSKTP